jgi:inorganic pyrophosphatase
MAKSKKRASDPTRIDPFDTDDCDVANRDRNPWESRNKVKYDQRLGLSRSLRCCRKAWCLPTPSDSYLGKAADGDPEDGLILMDEPTFSECVVLPD